MEPIFSSKKRIIKITYVTLVFVLFLVLNFSVSKGITPNGGDLEVIIGGQSILQNQTILTDAYSGENGKDTRYTGGISDDCLFLALIWVIYFNWRYKSVLYWSRRYTLVSLCVRMDE
ncbi:hypothetical protein Desor_4956 [Desulfosporosinus orientis DSM 765]|uniref:Uncharacterized protein n=1 Tax=Desulfosporosinus orientis (strain ATCC 19365 / DSM 765 / NCIMB 8382 / VKM B-1628 / Singapore I) TaxID=768706 RepID=G7WJ41_DESOD|nr:hypothetical protein Desor_4956 [Desulfosporosinus orientis DSM 765]